MNATSARATEPQLFERDPGRQSGSAVQQIMQSLRNITTLSEALRVLGAGVLLTSMILYLLQGWSSGNDISRYLLLLAQTGLLGIAGFAMSHGLREPRGARVFFGLALISIPANFTILGALLYSVFQWDDALSLYPAFATWRIDDMANIGLTLGAALTVLLPVTAFCYAIMARQSVRKLTLHYMALNALLLLPVRGSMLAGTLALLGIAYAVVMSRRMIQSNPALRTAEGRFALATLFVPMGIMLARSLYFYDVDSLMIAVLATAVYAAIRQAAIFPERSARVAAALDGSAIPVAAIAALALGEFAATMLSIGVVAPLAAMTFALFGADVLRRTPSGGVRRFASVTVSIALALGFIAAAAFEPSAATAGVALLAGIAMIAAGSWLKARSAVWTGTVTVAAGALFGFEPLIDVVVRGDWIALAVCGAVIITAASLLERHGAAWMQRARRWRVRRPASNTRLSRATDTRLKCA